MEFSSSESLEKLEHTLGYTFKDKSLLTEALTHPSFVFENKSAKHYQRFEFLGDAILGSILAEALFFKFPSQREGTLANLRSILGSGHILTKIAEKLNISLFIRISTVERNTQGHFRPSTQEDCLEALIAAIYLDSNNYSLTRDLVISWYGDIQDHIQEGIHDHNPKGKLQEWFQEKYSENVIEYRTVKTEGPPHQKTFEVQVWAKNQLLAQGTGTSKKEAEESAAKKALQSLHIQ